MSNIKKIILKHALKNKFDYGKANPGAIIGKVINEFPEVKKDIKSAMTEITAIVKKVNGMNLEDIKNKMKEFDYSDSKKNKPSGIEFPNALPGKVRTRFAPEPAGYLHIGHAKAVFLAYEGAKKYNGSMVLRFDDTNPGKAKQEFVDSIKKDLEWLGVNWIKETYTSDNLDKIYSAIKTLINKNKAYVCSCTREEISDNRRKGIPCSCRSKSKEENLNEFEEMLKGKFKEGERIIRYAGDMKSKNTVMRDPSIARIISKEHFRKKNKYYVWPGYDLAVVLMDAIEGITHPMRSKEYELRNELYYSLFDNLGYTRPQLIEFSRLSIKNAPVSKRLIRPLIEQKKVAGWDDPRLPTLAGLRRRGITKDAIKKFVLSFGLSKVESEPNWEILLSENRKLLNNVSKHYFFVDDVIELEITKADALPNKIFLNLHPKNDLGKRTINLNKKIVYITKRDFDKIKENEIFRLKDLCNVKLKQKSKDRTSSIVEFVSIEGKADKKIQWVSKEDAISCRILIPEDLLKNGEYNEDSLIVSHGFCEKDCLNLNVGEVVQFERYGYCRLDEKNKNELVFIFSC